MPTLHVRSIPETLYADLQLLAQLHQRSLSAQVVAMLAHGVEIERRQEEQSALLSAIRRRRFVPASSSPTTTDLLHEDRAR
jgi:plasmid stability protein